MSFGKIGGKRFIQELKQINQRRQFLPLEVVTLSGHEITMDYLFNHGFNDPILIEKPDGLQMKIPKDFSFEKLIEKLGEEHLTEVINVYKQETESMYLIDLVTAKENVNNRPKILNCISLELSKTPMKEDVELPSIVLNDLSWADNIFDADEKPAVQKYLLLSMKDSYTDFHIDFGGSSVWYHVFKGSKIFYFIRPTEKNIKAYEEWLVKKNHSEIFLPDELDDPSECYTFDLKEGNTALIPSGWIHGVYTPEDSIVFGGNYLQTFGANLQIEIFKLEERVQTDEKFLYPNFKVNLAPFFKSCSLISLFFLNLLNCS